MGINYNLLSRAKSMAGVTQISTGTYGGDLGRIGDQGSSKWHLLILLQAQGCALMLPRERCWMLLVLKALPAMGHHLGLPLQGFHGKAQAITWKTLFKSHLPIHITAWSLLLCFFSFSARKDALME